MADPKGERGVLPVVSATDARPTVDLGPGGGAEIPTVRASAFDPVANRFESHGELGRGGMGRVDDAFDRALGRPVAIKHMLSASGVDLARFEREARITARLEHPGIVPIHDAGRGADGTPYYVMRRIDGRPLDDLVAGKALADRLALIPNLLAAADAVAFAHARGIIHRDLKPPNILVGPFGETLVIDWGLAREIAEGDAATTTVPASDPMLTRAGTIAGTPGFMAPEQARGEAVDARADVFALGATLFYVVTGKLPYGAVSSTEMVGLAGANRPPDWRLVPHEVAADLRAIVVKAMASDSEQRYRDAGALAADLRQFLTGSLVGAHDYGPLAKLARFVRRHRAAVAVAAVSSVVLAVVATLSLRRVIAERDDATAARTLAETRQHEATAMAESMLVQHAREVAASNPPAAIGVLRKLPPESTHWREAWIAAATAWSHGIPFGFAGQLEPTLLRINTADEAFAIGMTTGRIVVIDLTTRTRREIATIGNTRGAAWLGRGHIVCSLETGIAVVDLATGSIRKLPLDIKQILGDRASRAWLLTLDRRLLELDDPAGEPREIATAVDDVVAAPDLSMAVIRHDLDIELWSPAKRWRVARLADAKWAPVLQLGDHQISQISEHEIVLSELRDDRIVELGRWPRGEIVQVAPTPRGVYADSIRMVQRLEGATWGPNLVEGTRSVTFLPTGMVVTRHDGSLLVLDAGGRLELGRYPYEIARSDLSIDGRFLAAVTVSGDLLAWDLRDMRPQTILIDKNEQLVGLGPRSLWVSDSLSGIRRRDLATGKDELVLEQHAPTGYTLIDTGERFAALVDRATHRVQIYDAPRGTIALPDPYTQFAIDRDGFVGSREDGSLWRWKPTWTELRPIGRFATSPLDLATNGRYVLATIAKQQVARLDTVDNTIVTTTLPEAIETFVIEPTGEMWLVTHDGALRRWNPPAAPVAVPTPEPIDTMIATTHGVLAHGKTSLIELGDRSTHPIPLVAREYAWDGGDLIVATSIQYVVSVIDLVTGLGFPLPLQATGAGGIVAVGGHIAYGYHVSPGGLKIALWDIRVPQDPAELRKWLVAVTNAKPGDNDVVVWP